MIKAGEQSPVRDNQWSHDDDRRPAGIPRPTGATEVATTICVGRYADHERAANPLKQVPVIASLSPSEQSGRG